MIPNPPSPTSPFFVIAFDSAGIYIVSRPPWTGGHRPSTPSGLWIADPRTGSVRNLTDTGTWLYVGGGAAWGVDLPLKDAFPGEGTRLVRLDVKTGDRQLWLATEQDLQLDGIDAAGDPVIEVGESAASRSMGRRLWLVDGRDHHVDLGPTPPIAPPQVLGAGSVFEDEHGIWLTSATDELWLYSPTSGLKLVHVFADGITRQIAGPCR